MWLGRRNVPKSENNPIIDQSPTTRKIYSWNNVMFRRYFAVLTCKHTDMETRNIETMKIIAIENQAKNLVSGIRYAHWGKQIRCFGIQKEDSPIHSHISNSRSRCIYMKKKNWRLKSMRALSVATLVLLVCNKQLLFIKYCICIKKIYANRQTKLQNNWYWWCLPSKNTMK